MLKLFVALVVCQGMLGDPAPLPARSSAPLPNASDVQLQRLTDEMASLRDTVQTLVIRRGCECAAEKLAPAGSFEPQAASLLEDVRALKAELAALKAKPAPPAKPATTYRTFDVNGKEWRHDDPEVLKAFIIKRNRELVPPPPVTYQATPAFTSFPAQDMTFYSGGSGGGACAGGSCAAPAMGGFSSFMGGFGGGCAGGSCR